MEAVVSYAAMKNRTQLATSSSSVRPEGQGYNEVLRNYLVGGGLPAVISGIRDRGTRGG